MMLMLLGHCGHEDNHFELICFVEFLSLVMLSVSVQFVQQSIHGSVFVVSLY